MALPKRNTYALFAVHCRVVVERYGRARLHRGRGPRGALVAGFRRHRLRATGPDGPRRWQPQEAPGDGPVGYFGINMGTAIGVPLVAIEPRITAAVFGQHWPDVLDEKAKQITIPIEFDMQWDDEHIPREAGLALFDAFASKEKTLHA